jgi:hypothetical protein
MIEHSEVIAREGASAIDILNPFARHAFIRSVFAFDSSECGLVEVLTCAPSVLIKLTT